MSMKNKLRRAFDLNKPDVLCSILDDCPAPEKIVASKPKRKLSDRTKEFIATAAALALIISAVGGGFVYYRDYFSSTSPDRADTPGTNAPDTTTPPDLNEPIQSEPDQYEPTVDLPLDPDWTEPAPDEKTISWLAARDIALELWGFTMNDVKDLKIACSEGMYQVYFECGESAYGMYINAEDGSVVYDEGCMFIGLRPDEQMEHLIGWVKARDLCLYACGRSVEELIGITWEYRSGDPGLYYMELYFPDGDFCYRLNALDGTFQDDTAEKPDTPDGCIGADVAIQIAVHKAGLMEDYIAGAIEDFACKFDDRDPDSKCYWIYFQVRGISYEIAVHAYTGEVLSCQASGTEEFYSDKDAIQRALNYSHFNEDRFVRIECLQLGTATNRTVYLVIFDNYIYTMVDANTLRVMDVDNPFPADVIDQKTAVLNSLSLAGIEVWEEQVLIMKGVFNDGHPFYCIKFYKGNQRYVSLVDAYSGEVLSHHISESVLGHYTDLALHAALKHVDFTMDEVTDISYEYDVVTDPELPRNRIFFTVGKLRYEVIVSAHSSNHLEILEVYTTEIA